MRYLIILIAAAIALVGASPVEVENTREKIFLTEENTRNSILEQLVLDLIEEFRELMVTGSNTFPVLDPLYVSELYFDQYLIPILPGYINIKDFTMDNLSTFVINEFGLTMASLLQQRYRLILDGHVPVVDFNAGRYDLDLSVFGGSIFGSGEMSLRIVEPRIRANIVLSIRLSGGIFITLEECRLSVSVGSFDPKITGLFNDPVLSDFISVFLKHFVEEILVVMEDDITEFLSVNVLEIGNQILADLDLSTILGV
ncbi:uncharacterized protein LOC106707839 [Papilio machaon]|uniref:uncharacterized protein LOC106707839 n=1 Tax=Papilio machaon TaxID=76193 RepID=UPI001E66595A|nr:uncharacterized protein LOC106707839 [Papilio machaon]